MRQAYQETDKRWRGSEVVEVAWLGAQCISEVLAGAVGCLLVQRGACWCGGVCAGAAGCLLVQIIWARERSGPRHLLGGAGQLGDGGGGGGGGGDDGAAQQHRGGGGGGGGGNAARQHQRVRQDT